MFWNKLYVFPKWNQTHQSCIPFQILMKKCLFFLKYIQKAVISCTPSINMILMAHLTGIQFIFLCIYVMYTMYLNWCYTAIICYFPSICIEHVLKFEIPSCSFSEYIFLMHVWFKRGIKLSEKKYYTSFKASCFIHVF